MLSDGNTTQPAEHSAQQTAADITETPRHFNATHTPVTLRASVLQRLNALMSPEGTDEERWNEALDAHAKLLQTMLKSHRQRSALKDALDNLGRMKDRAAQHADVSRTLFDSPSTIEATTPQGSHTSEENTDMPLELLAVLHALITEVRITKQYMELVLSGTTMLIQTVILDPHQEQQQKSEAQIERREESDSAEQPAPQPEEVEAAPVAIEPRQSRWQRWAGRLTWTLFGITLGATSTWALVRWQTRKVGDVVPMPSDGLREMGTYVANGGAPGASATTDPSPTPTL